MTNYYDILGVAPASEDVVITAAYRALMRKYHPDVYRGESSHARQMAQKLNDAYAILGHPGRRAAYDAHLAQGRRSENAGQRSPPRPPPPPPPPSASPSTGTAGSSGDGNGRYTEARYGELDRGFSHAWLAIAAPVLVYLLSGGVAPDPAVQVSASLPDGWALDEAAERLADPRTTGGEEVVVDSNATPASEERRVAPETAPISPDAVVAVDNAKGFREEEQPSVPPNDELYSGRSLDEDTIRITCAAERGNGISAYKACLRAQASAAKSNPPPSLRSLDPEDADTVRITCASERGYGPASYNPCLRRHAASALRNGYPSMTSISSDDADTIRISCASKRGDGPLEYNRCLKAELSNLQGK